MANQNSLGRDSETRDLEAPTPSEADTSFGDILSQYERSRSSLTNAPGGAEGREATVVAISGESVFLDVGLKTEGIMPVGGFRDPAGNLTVKPGDKMQAAITGRDPEGYYQLSLIRVARPKDWSSLERAFAEKRAIAGVVSGLIKGGVTVDVGVRAFLPGSRSGTKDATELQALVGQEISCRIIKLDVADEDVVVDRRVVLEEEEK
nr:30S ribosomal protein S1 [Acidobacteriota bacterium]